MINDAATHSPELLVARNSPDRISPWARAMRLLHVNQYRRTRYPMPSQLHNAHGDYKTQPVGRQPMDTAQVFCKCKREESKFLFQLDIMRRKFFASNSRLRSSLEQLFLKNNTKSLRNVVCPHEKYCVS